MSENNSVSSPESFWASKRRAEKYTKISVTIILFIGSVIMMLPILWMISASFKDPNDVFKGLLPTSFHPENYINAWNIMDPKTGRAMHAGEDWDFLGIPFHGINFTTYVVNTLIIAIATTVGTTISSSLVAFAFARLRFPGRGPLFILCLATMMVPAQVTMIPTYILWNSLRAVDTFWPLILPSFLGGGAYNIFLMRQFFMSIPYEMDEAAKIDGCTNWGVYWRILLPLCKPALTTVAVFSFVYNWNDFMSPLIYISSESKMTLALGLQNFCSLYGNNYPLLMAASLLMLLPIALIFLFGQRFFIQGIATTGLK